MAAAAGAEIAIGGRRRSSSAAAVGTEVVVKGFSTGTSSRHKQDSQPRSIPAAPLDPRTALPSSSPVPFRITSAMPAPRLRPPSHKIVSQAKGSTYSRDKGRQSIGVVKKLADFNGQRMASQGLLDGFERTLESGNNINLSNEQ